MRKSTAAMGMKRSRLNFSSMVAARCESPAAGTNGDVKARSRCPRVSSCRRWSFKPRARASSRSARPGKELNPQARAASHFSTMDSSQHVKSIIGIACESSACARARVRTSTPSIPSSAHSNGIKPCRKLEGHVGPVVMDFLNGRGGQVSFYIHGPDDL
ncbi:hypothetical protein EYF80_060369 [Liparis tanakae]|uniref:Uncharacterized protein n=1 Tax=Liparis tanakae TaxID=230148 RepID=A0A4Z2EKX4_9TELE|nr:hypothetical protein EYF80_060369 [Liparis tanakae]